VIDKIYRLLHSIIILL